MSINKWINKMKVVYSHYRILFSHKQEWCSDTYYNMHEACKHYFKWNYPNQKVTTIWFHLYEISRIGKFIETESRLEVTRAGVRGSFPPATLSLFSVFKSLLWFASFSVFILFFLPFPYVHLLCFLNSTYEWNHMVFVFLWLTYFA